MRTQNVGVTGQQGQQNPTGKNAFDDVGMEQFLKLMIAELQNQDPMNPMSNQEMLQQINSIREIESNTRLTDSLEAVRLGQNMATAGSLIGRIITGLSDDETRITGRVDRISIADGAPTLHVGDQSVKLDNVAEILAEIPDDETNQQAE